MGPCFLQMLTPPLPLGTNIPQPQVLAVLHPPGMLFSKGPWFAFHAHLPCPFSVKPHWPCCGALHHLQALSASTVFLSGKPCAFPLYLALLSEGDQKAGIRAPVHCVLRVCVQYEGSIPTWRMTATTALGKAESKPLPRAKLRPRSSLVH